MPRRRRRTLFVSRWWPLTLLMKPWHFGRSEWLRAALVSGKQHFPSKWPTKKNYRSAILHLQGCDCVFWNMWRTVSIFWLINNVAGCYHGSNSSRLAFNDLVAAVTSVATNIDIGPHRCQKDVKRIQKRSNWSTKPYLCQHILIVGRVYKWYCCTVQTAAEPFRISIWTSFQ